MAVVRLLTLVVFGAILQSTFRKFVSSSSADGKCDVAEKSARCWILPSNGELPSGVTRLFLDKGALENFRRLSSSARDEFLQGVQVSTTS